MIWGVNPTVSEHKFPKMSTSMKFCLTDTTWVTSTRGHPWREIFTGKELSWSVWSRLLVLFLQRFFLFVFLNVCLYPSKTTRSNLDPLSNKQDAEYYSINCDRITELQLVCSSGWWLVAGLLPRSASPAAWTRTGVSTTLLTWAPTPRITEWTATVSRPCTLPL